MGNLVEHIESNLTPADVAAWHEGRQTDHVSSLCRESYAKVIAIWGSHDGPEPLTVEIVQFDIDALADSIYREVFGHIDSKTHCAEKTGEITDWLALGDLDGTETMSDLVEEWREADTPDRTEQIDWLRQLAANMVEASPEGETAESIVAYATSSEGTEAWAIHWPSWCDDHDQRLLVQFVGESLPSNKAIGVMVNERAGVYELIGSACLENWSVVQQSAGVVERIEDLTGHSPWTAAYRIRFNDRYLWYFVAEKLESVAQYIYAEVYGEEFGVEPDTIQGIVDMLEEWDFDGTDSLSDLVTAWSETLED